MKYLASIVILISLFCSHISLAGDHIATDTFDDDRVVYGDVSFLRYEIPFYTFAEFTPQVALRMEYAKFEVLNNEDWLKKSKRNEAYEIDLVFTKYPKELSRWRTNYRQLLLDRLESLFLLDSTLRESHIKWNLILQTQCDTEEKAKEYFHGFVIKYRPRRIPVIERVTDPKQLRALISGRVTTKDSTVFKVMERNTQWDKMLVVMDWTGSMYKYGAQLVIWHKLNAALHPDKVKHFVFFNDGNNKKTWQKRMGKTGGVYRAKTGDLEEIVETMEYVMKKGNGGDPEENDLEALLTGMQYLDDFDDIILIADNKSEVRDLELLREVNKPVHVILCDYRGKIHPDYKKIAEDTGGSIHTLEKDLNK